MKPTVKQQKSILKMIQAEVSAGNGIKTIAALLRGYGNPDNVWVDGNKVSVKVSYNYTYLYLKDGY